jgi:CheY-like chemotaxis protein
MHSAIPVLLVEDEENDVLLMQLAFKEARLPTPLMVVNNGDEAIGYLSGKGPYAERGRYPLPFVILLDLHLPGTNGFELLKWLRRYPDAERFCPVVLTSSDLDIDRQHASALGACDYMVKPNKFDELVQIVRDIYTQWISPTDVSLAKKRPSAFQAKWSSRAGLAE